MTVAERAGVRLEALERPWRSGRVDNRPVKKESRPVKKSKKGGSALRCGPALLWIFPPPSAVTSPPA
jgi:hypothetical protein